MIDLDKLRAVATIVTHQQGPGEPCADGVASALIALDALPGRRVVWMNYNTPEHRDLRAEPGLLFVDMTPPRDRVAEFVAAGAIVLDHHAHARDIVEAFGPLGVFADEATQPGVSGAMLAYEEVWSPLYRASGQYGTRRIEAQSAHQLAELAGIRDTWQRKDHRWREACAQAEALCFWPWAMLERCGPEIGALREVGEVLLSRAEARAERQRAEGVRFDVGPLRCLALEASSHETSNVAALAGVDLTIGWHYTAESGRAQLVLHLRSPGSFDCGAFAKVHRGGGHSGSGGFRLTLAPLAPDPYTTARALVEEWVRKGGGR